MGNKMTTTTLLSNNERETILAKHNYYRKLFNVPLLEYDETLSKFSQARADTIVRNGKIQHEPSCKYGENLYATSGDDITHAVDSWCSERFSYDVKKNNWNEGKGHFSQCVWQNSTKLGIGKGLMANGFTVLVCNYDPAGNIMGQRPYPIQDDDNDIDELITQVNPITVDESESEDPEINEADS